MTNWSKSDYQAYVLKQAERARAIRANKDHKAESIRAPSESQCDLGHESLATHQVEERNTGRIIISYRIFRRRKLDPDNCFTKYHTDALRYKCLIRDDREQDIVVTTQQIKSKEEYVEIEIIYP